SRSISSIVTVRYQNPRIASVFEMSYSQSGHREFVMTDRAKYRKINEEISRQINRETRNNPQSPYANKIVGIASGKVVTVGDDLDEVAERLRQIEPDAAKCALLEASRDYAQVEEIWGLR